MPRTTIGQRWRVIAFTETGIRAPTISKHLGITQRTVYNIFRRHAARPNEVSDLPRSGRLQKTSPREKRNLGRIAQRNRFSTSTELCRRLNLRLPVSTSLVRRRLLEMNYRNRRPVRNPLLTFQHRRV